MRVQVFGMTGEPAVAVLHRRFANGASDQTLYGPVLTQCHRFLNGAGLNDESIFIVFAEPGNGWQFVVFKQGSDFR